MRSHLRLLQATEDPSGESAWVEVRIPSSRLPRGLAALLVALLAGTLLAALAHQRARTETTLVRVTVARGDTLWGLATRHCDPGQYLPKAVHDIRRANGLSTSRLMPGQQLVIPVRSRAAAEMPACMSIARANTP